MRCLSPITVENPQYKCHIGLQRFIEVPCGRCAACRQNYSLDWSIRIFEEAKSWFYWSFLTLTYTDTYLSEKDMFVGDYVPDSKKILCSLSKEDIKRYLKSCRKKLPPRSFSYFLCGEYGSHTARPHAHCILMFNDPCVLDVFKSVWKRTRGTVFISRNRSSLLDYNKQGDDLNGAVSYACKYACKKSTFPYLYDSEGNWKECFEKPFRLMSKSIGLCYSFDPAYLELDAKLKNFGSVITDSDLVYHLPNGKCVGLPRYYRNRLIKKMLPDEQISVKTVTPFGDVIQEPKTVVFTNSNYRRYIANKRMRDIRDLRQTIKRIGQERARIREAQFASYSLAESERQFDRRDESDFSKERF